MPRNKPMPVVITAAPANGAVHTLRAGHRDRRQHCDARGAARPVPGPGAQRAPP